MLNPETKGVLSLSNHIARAVFGKYAAREKALVFLRLGALVVGLDFATKVVALLALREGDPIAWMGGAVQFALAFNATALGGTARTAIDGANIARALGTWTSMGLLSAASLHYVSAEWSFWKKVRVVVILCVASAIGGVLIGSPFYGALGDGAIPPVKVLTTAAFGFLLLRIARTRNTFLLFAALESANLANTLNLIAYPRGVIDFIRFTPLDRWMGVANLADYLMKSTMILLLAYFPVRATVPTLVSARPGWRGTLRSWVDEPLAPITPAQPAAAL